jgi:hypothetical protein
LNIKNPTIAAKPRATRATPTPIPALAPVESPARDCVGDVELVVGCGVLIDDVDREEEVLEAVSAALSEA